MVSNCTIWPSELDQKGPLFPRNIPYRARPKSPPFQFFSALRDIFFGYFPPQKAPCLFLDVLRQNGCWKIPKGPPLSVFLALWDFFPKIIFFSIFSCFATEWMLKNLKGSPLSVFRHCETFFRKFVFSPKGPPFNCDKNVDKFGSVLLLARQGLALAGPGAPLGSYFCFFDFRVL